MNISEICVKRPVFSIMLTMLLIVLGVFSYFKLGVDLMPNVDFPVVIINTYLPGASPEEIETNISKKIEEAVNSISGIDELRSTSTYGMSRVFIRFVLEKDIDVAVSEVREKVSIVQRQLPFGTDPPVISKIDPTAQPIIKLIVSGNRNMIELTEITRKKIKEILETLYGVGEITLNGTRARVVNVFIDKDKLEQYNLSILNVKNAILAQNIEMPVGRITQKSIEFGLRILGYFYTMEDFNSLIINFKNNKPITLSDIGYAENSEEEPRSISRLNKKPSITLEIKKQAGTNTVKVIETILSKIDEIKSTLPNDIKIIPIGDQSRFIKASLNEIKNHLILGALLTAIIVFIFMGSIRATIISFVSIPVSLIATFTLMYYMNFTLNNITLLALALALGIVIDDAIVVIENVFRMMNEKKLSAYQAAIDGTKEITLAVLATTISLIIIFLPIAFMSGVVGRLFQSYGLTCAFAIGVSLFVALTSTPTLCSFFLKPNSLNSHNHNEENDLWINKILNKNYGKLIEWSLNNKLTVILISFFVLYITIPLFKQIGKDFMPYDDTSEIEVSITTPPNWALDKIDRIIGEIEDKILKLKDVKSVLANIGSSDTGNITNSSLFITIEDLTKRKYHISEKIREIRKILSSYPELRCGVQVAGGRIIGGRFATLTFSITGPDLTILEDAAKKMKKELQNRKGYIDVDSSADDKQTEFKILLDRIKMAELGITVSDFISAVKILIGGEKVSKFKDYDEQFDIILRLNEKDRNTPDAIYDLKIANKSGKLIPVINFAKIEQGLSPIKIERLNRERQYTISSDLEPSKPLNVAMNEINQIFESLKLPLSYKVSFLGQARLLNEALNSFLMAFILSIILMYIVLASQFESFLHPITILLTLPLSVPFALISLIMAGETLNIYSIFGLFMLFGIVKKNAILQIDYTNTLREEGLNLKDAIIKANITRLRPILMTTFTLIFGMLPIALGQGPGAQARASMAKVIIGGQFLCLLLTLIIVPVAYELFDKITNWIKTKFSNPIQIN